MSTVYDRLWSKIDVRGPDECWPWLGHTNNHGYGTLYTADGNQKAHRLVYKFCVGPIPKKILVLHSCDNPPCCNPAHLFLGTHAVNSADMIAKGRSARGEKLKRTKLKADQIVVIRQSRKSNAALAKQYAVGHSAISKIRHGRTWAWLVDTPR